MGISIRPDTQITDFEPGDTRQTSYLKEMNLQSLIDHAKSKWGNDVDLSHVNIIPEHIQTKCLLNDEGDWEDFLVATNIHAEKKLIDIHNHSDFTEIEPNQIVEFKTDGAMSDYDVINCITCMIDSLSVMYLGAFMEASRIRCTYEELIAMRDILQDRKQYQDCNEEGAFIIIEAWSVR